MSKQRGVLVRRRVREVAPLGPPSALPGPSSPAPTPRPVGALAQRLQTAAPRAPTPPTMPAPQPAPSVPQPTAPGVRPPPLPTPGGGLAGRLRQQSSGLPQTTVPPTPEGQQAYHGAKTQLEGRGVQVHDLFESHHDLGARAKTFQAAHEALGHVSEVLPALSRLPGSAGLQVHFRGAPQQVAAGQVHGQYVKAGGAPRLEVNDQSPETLWHEHMHAVDHAMNGGKGDASLGNMASSQRDHPMRTFADSLMQSPSHQAFRNRVLQEEMDNPSEGRQRLFYLTHPSEAVARFGSELMSYTHAQKTGQPRAPVSSDSEGYTPAELEQYGTQFRKMLSQNALSVGGRFQREGPMQVYTPGAEGVREADGGPVAPEAPVPSPVGPRVRLKGATSQAPSAPAPSTPAPEPPAHFPAGVGLPPSMKVDERGLRIQTPYRTPDAPGSGVPRQTLHKDIPPERRPPRELTFPPPPAHAPRTTWLSPAEIAAGQTYVRGLHDAGQGGERTPHSGALQAGLRGAWDRARAADERPTLQAPTGHEFAEEFSSLMPGLGMYGPVGEETAGGLPPSHGVTNPAGWGDVQHSPQSLERYQNRPRLASGQELAQDDFTQPRPLPDRPSYQLSPEEFHAAPYALHRGGTGAAPKEEGAMWLTPNRRLAEDYANQRLGQQPRHERSQWDESLPGASVTSGLLDTTKFATEKEINAALERSGMTMGDLSHYMPRSDGGYAPYQALYMPDILDDLKGQGYGAFEGVGQQSGPFYVKFPGTNFLQHGDVVRRAHGQGLDVGEENRRRYSLGQQRTAPGGQTFRREGPPTVQAPGGPQVPSGHYTTPTSPGYSGVREAAGHVPGGPPYPRPAESGHRLAHEAHAEVERARAAYRDTWRPDAQGRRPAQLLAERRLRARAAAASPPEEDEEVGPALAAEGGLAQALAARALARRLLGPAPGPLPWEEDHESAPGEGHHPVGPRPARDAERARRRRAARTGQGELHPDEDWLRTQEELMHQRGLHEALAARGWAPTPHERRELALAQGAHHAAMNRRPTGAGPLVQDEPSVEEEAPDVRRARLLYGDPEQVPAPRATAQRATAQFHSELERRHGPGAGPRSFAEHLRLALLRAEEAAAHDGVREAQESLGPLARPQPLEPAQAMHESPTAPEQDEEPQAPRGPLAAPSGAGAYGQHYARARAHIQALSAPTYTGPERRQPRFVSMVPQATAAERADTEQLLGPGRTFEEHAHRASAFNVGAPPAEPAPGGSAMGPLGRAPRVPRKEEASAPGL